VIKTKRAREREGVFVLEGTRPILELLQTAPHRLLSVVVAPSFLDRQSLDIRQQLLRSGCAVYTCPEERLGQLSDVESPAGALAIVRQPIWDQSTVLAQPKVFGLYGDMLRDPTNMGAIIRTAAGFNVSGLWLAPNSVDVFNPKVVRATAGTLFQLPIFSHTGPEELLALNCMILASDAGTRGGTVPIRSIQAMPARTIVAIGSESRGLSEAILKVAKVRFTIPLAPGVESLNAAAAAAIALFHLSGVPLESPVA